MARTRVTVAQSADTIKKNLHTLGEEYAAAIEAHEKSSEDARKLQQQKDEALDKLQRLSFVPGMTKTAYRALKKQVEKQKEIYENIENQLKKAVEAEKLAKDDMEEAEAMWKFVAMSSGEVYQENGIWKWRQ
ncbi:unnamed protein product [Caenorhabditis nigoni]